jgi:hypothetical protein
MTPPKVLVHDDVRRGFELTSTWALVRFPPRFAARSSP